MERRAKDAAQQKISQWTGTRRNVSKTTTKSENTNAVNENRIPLQTHSPSDLNAMKNCTVRLEKMPAPAKVAKTTQKASKKPAKIIPAADVIAKDKPNDAKNVYDYSFDADEPSPLENAPEMKDILEKLAKENKIQVKKYRPKNGKKIKPNNIDADKKVPTTKRRREKQPVDVEPPKKKPNLKSKVNTADVQKSVAPSAGIARPKRNVETENVANNNVAAKKVVVIAPTVTKPVTPLNPHKQVDTGNSGYVNTLQRLRNRNAQEFQSTLKSSTPLGTKATAANNAKNHSLNSLFDNVSPLTTSVRSTRGNIQKQRLQLSAIQDSVEEVPTPSKGHTANENQNENAAQPNNFDYNDFDFGNDFGNDLANEQPDLEVDKENSLDRPSTSVAALRSSGRSETVLSASNAQNRPRIRPAAWDQPSTSAAWDQPSTSTAWNQPSTSAAAFKTPDKSMSSSSLSNVQRHIATSSANQQSRDQPSTSAAARNPLTDSNDRSVFNIKEASEYNVFSPTQRRVYGRSPLKNITSEVNNRNSPSFESSKSPATMPRSFGTLAKSTINSLHTINSTKSSELTLPEASYFSSRRAPQDFDRIVDNENLIDDCFGFGLDDDEDIVSDDTINKTSQNVDKTAINLSKSVSDKDALQEIRERLKRFLHHPEAKQNESVKKTKVTTSETAPGKGKAKKVTTPMKNSTAKAVKSPSKQKRNVVFGEAAAKQKDIRNAFTGKSGDKDTNAKSNSAQNEPAVNLFTEIETVQDRRRSYSRPQRRRKRRISIDSDESEKEEEQHSEDEDYDENGKPTKRAKRRKKTTVPNPKELEELEEFARKTNQHFDEVDSFELMVE